MKRSLVLTLLVAALACASPAATGAPAITVTDSIVLHEDPDHPLGAFAGFWNIASDGSIWIGNATAQQVLVFEGDGRFRRVLGQPGDGPGEFGLPGAILPLDATGEVAVVDLNRSRVIVFDTAGHFVRETVSPFQHAGPAVAFAADTMVLALPLGETPFARWHPGSDAIADFGALRTDIVPGSQSVILSSGIPGVIRNGDGYVLWSPGYGLSEYGPEGSVQATYDVPRAARRGEGAALVEQALQAGRGGATSLLSTAVGIGTDIDGNVLLASQDSDRDSTGRGTVVNLRTFLTVLRADLTEACLDGLVPVLSDMQHLVLFRNGAPWVLRHAVTPAGEVRSVVFRLAVDLSACEWQPVVRG